MSKPTQPSEIAREVLRQLAMRRSLPTPDNYASLYHEISGTSAAELFPEKALKNLANAMPRKTPEQLRFARQIETAVGEKSWESLKNALHAFSSAAAAEPPQWSALIRDLLQQVERNQAGLTPAKKREAIDRLLQASTSPELLFSRLQSTLRTWSQAPNADGVPALTEEGSAAPESPPQEASSTSPAAARALSAKLNDELQQLIAQLLENNISILLSETPDLASEANQLAIDVRAARSPKDIAEFTARMKKFSYRLQFATEDQAEMRTMLLHLLRLIVDNISELVIDDRLLHGQIATVIEIIDQPLNLRQLDDVERRMKDVIYKQGVLKKHLSEAQDRLKSMLANFVDHLADFAEITSGYHDKIERCAMKISQSGNMSQLSEVLVEVMDETRVVQLSAQRSRDELRQMRQRVYDAEKEVERLQTELTQASDMVRQDPLTGALNRKGMEEALEREVARFLRHQSTLCLAMLDIDNFKKLNDTYGHHVGDAALVHLANVIRETIRPQDTLARYGGEEFVILLPETPLDDAVVALTRLQRELTRKFFMNNNEKMLITFSAGVAEIGTDEPSQAAMKRADEAMYLAKRAGKNRVVAA
jgi:diguanylate cyclase